MQWQNVRNGIAEIEGFSDRQLREFSTRRAEILRAVGGTDASRAARVVRVIDGDTIEARLRGKKRDVRLIGIDTPEVFGGEECGGAEASESMRDLLSRGTRITLIRDRSQDNRDAFGRLLRYVERRGRDVGKRQIARGWP